MSVYKPYGNNANDPTSKYGGYKKGNNTYNGRNRVILNYFMNQTKAQPYFVGRPNTVKNEPIKPGAVNPDLVPGFLPSSSLPDNYTDADWRTYNARKVNRNDQFTYNMYNEIRDTA